MIDGGFGWLRLATQRLLDRLPASNAGRAKPAADAMVAAGAAAKAAGNAAPGGSWSGRRSRKAPSAAMKPCCGTPLDLY